jgi:multidrug efflux pump subunit AcrA (membrane-fusion protein)
MPPRRRSRKLPIAIALLVVLAGSYATYRATRKVDVEGQDTRATSDTATVLKTSFDITTLATGELEAKKQVELRSRLEQQTVIQEIIAEGTRVKAGEVLVRLNADKIQTQYDEQLLQIETAKSEFVAAENGYNIQVNENANNLRNAALKVTLAELSLSQWLEGEVKTKREANRLALSQSKLELDRLAEKLIRSQKLQEQGFLSKDELDRDELDYIRAQSAWIKAQLDDKVYEQYQFPKDEKQKRGDLDQANSELTKVKMNAEIDLASKSASRNNKRTQLTIRENTLAKLKQQLDASVVTAPSDGLVVYATSIRRNMWGGGEGPLQIGRQVYPNELLIVLPDTSEMVASVQVHESLAGDVKPGMAAMIKVDAVGGKSFQGTVDSIGVLAEAGGWRDPDRREYTVKIKLEAGEEIVALKPSMRCEARLTLGRVDDAIAIPVQGVFSDGPVRFTYAKSGKRYERTPIKIGKRSDTYAEVLAGVNPGSTVLLRDPTPSEVLAGPWDKARLELAGYSLDEKGNPVVSGGRGPRSGPAPRGAKPTTAKPSEAPVADAAKTDSKKPEPETAKPAEAKPAETKPIDPKPVATVTPKADAAPAK